MKAKILLYDIETAPSLGYIWGKYEQNVLDFVREGYILCFAYKWLGEKKTHVIGLPDFALYKKDPENDLEVIKVLHNLFSQADVVIAHNGNSFDQKTVNTGFSVHGLNPPEPYKQLDTKLVARKYFRFNSNKLDDLGRNLGVGRKINPGGFELWQGCMRGDPKAWRRMMAYNKQDAMLLERVYLKLLPWIDNHPAINLLTEDVEACPKCGGHNMQSRGQGVNKTTVYRRFQCRDCGGWSRQRVTDRQPVQFVN